ncbi:MAG: SdpI family protein [Phycisphaerae bacterium]
MIPRSFAVAIAIIIGLSLCAGLGALPFMPERVPSHWNISGEVDAYGSPWQAALLMPGTALGIALLMAAFPLMGPFRANFDQFRVTYGRLALVTTLTLAMIHAVILLAALGWRLRVGAALSIIIGVQIALLGNWLGKIRRNFYIGIRTPWTIANEIVWERTHRLGGKLFVAAGCISVLAGFVAPDWVCFVVMMTSLGIAALTSGVYSYAVYRGLAHADDLP